MPRRPFITGVVFVLYLLSTLVHTSYGQTAQTQNIAPDADLSVVGYPSTKPYQAALAGITSLLVGDFLKVPFISYLRFNLSSIQTSNWLTTVSHTTVLRLMAKEPMQNSTNHDYIEPMQNSTNLDYIVTVALADCKNPYWKVEDFLQSNCPLTDVDTSTENSIVIADSSLPNFYEWTVTSAVEKALPKGEVTLRVTGYALNAKDFNGGVKFWNKEITSYYGNLFAGPPMLTVTTTTAPSPLANFTIAAVVVIVAPIVGWLWHKKKPPAANAHPIQ
jgi:hypothetical protein